MAAIQSQLDFNYDLTALSSLGLPGPNVYLLRDLTWFLFYYIFFKLFFSRR